mgnify:CR=1 FL=1
MKNKIEELKKSKMNISKISIADFTTNHQNHKNYEGGGHFQAVIISDDFKDLSLLERHWSALLQRRFLLWSPVCRFLRQWFHSW